MRNHYIFSVLFQKWKDFFNANFSGIAREDFSEIEQKLRIDIAQLLLILAKIISSDSSAEEIKKVVDSFIQYCTKELEAISKIDPEFHVLTLDDNYLNGLSRMLMDTRSLLTIYSNENYSEAAQASQSKQDEVDKIFSQLCAMENTVKAFSLQNHDLRHALTLIEEMKALALNLQKVADLATTLTPGGWGTKFKNLWVHLESYKDTPGKSRIENAYEGFRDNIQQYISCYQIALQKNDLLSFFQAHVKGTSCIDSRLRAVNIWCEDRKYFTETHFSRSISPWEQFLLDVTAFLKENATSSAEDLLIKFRTTLDKIFADAFPTEMIGFNGGALSDADFLNQIKAKVNKDIEEVISDKVQQLFADYATETFALNFSIDNPDALIASMAIRQEQLVRTDLFAGVKKRPEGSTVKAASSASKKEKFSVINTLLNALNQDDKPPTVGRVMEVIDLLSSIDSHLVYPLTMADLVDDGKQPLLHWALRQGDAALIAKVMALRDADDNFYEVINAKTRQTTMHVLAEIADGNTHEIIFAYRYFLQPQQKITLIAAMDSANNSFFNTLLKNPNLSESEIEVIFSEVILPFLEDKAVVAGYLETLFTSYSQKKNTLALAAERGFTQIVKFLLRVLAQVVLVAYDAKEILKQAFYPENSKENSPAFLAYTNHFGPTCLELLTHGAIHPFSSQDKQLFPVKFVPHIMHAKQLVGWTPERAAASLSQTQLPPAYWDALFQLAATQSADFFERRRNLALLKISTQKVPADLIERQAKAETNIKKFLEILYQYELYLRSLQNYFPRSVAHITYHYLSAIEQFIIKHQNLLQILLSVAITGAMFYAGSYTIIYGQDFISQANATGQNITDLCTSFGGKFDFHDHYDGNDLVLRSDGSNANWATQCCRFAGNFTSLCHSLTNPLHDSAHYLIHRGRGFETLGSVVIIWFIVGVAVGMCVLAVAAAILASPYWMLKNFVKNDRYDLRNTSIIHANKIHNELTPLFEKLISLKILPAGFKATLDAVKQDNSKLLDLVILAQHTLSKMLCELPYLVYSGSEITLPNLSQISLPRFAPQGPTEVVVHKWSLNKNRFVVVDVEDTVAPAPVGSINSDASDERQHLLASSSAGDQKFRKYG